MKTPFNVLAKHNSWDNVPREPITIGNIILAGLNISTPYLSVIWLTGFVATTLVAGALMRALMPSPPKMQQGLLGNFRQAASPWDVVYGQVRKGGTITYMESTGDTNKYLHMIITLAGHEVEEIGDIYINDKVVTIDGNDEVTSEPWVSGAGGADKWITIKKFTGASNQDIYNSLQSMTDGPTFENEGQTNTPSNFKGQGISCIYVRMEYNRDVFASGIPSFSAVVKGKKVYDPRTSTTGWSANAALCIRDYLVSEYGLNTLASSIDDTYFSTAANDCDTSSGSGESNKFEINGVITTSANIRTNLQDMVGACVGNLYYSAGQFKLVAGVYSPSVKTLTLDDLRSEISLNTRTSRRDNFNSVQGTFIWGGVDDGTDSGGDWTEFDYPAITSPTFVTEDNEYDNPLQLDLPLTTGSATAQRIAKQTLFRAREQMSFSAEFGMSAFDLQIGDTVSLTLDRYGWDEKEFEVVNWGFKADQDAGDLRVTLGLRETSSAAFDWDAEEQGIISNNSNLPVGFTVSAPTNLTLTNSGFLNGGTGGDGTFVPSVLASWGASVDSFVVNYEVEWKKSSETEYNQTITTSTQVDISPLEAGETYQFRVLARNSLGVASSYITSSILTTGDTTAPSAPSVSSATGGYNTITLDWTNPTDKDFKQALIYRNTSNTSASASLVAATDGDTFIDGALPQSTTRYYWVKAEDYSGNISGFSNGVSATTNANPADGQDGQNARGFIMSNPAHTVPAGRSGVVESYAGSGTDIEVLDGSSRLSWIDSGTPSSGQFTFSSVSVSPSGAITVGARTGIPAGVRVADHSSMDVNEDLATITYAVSGRTNAGTSFSFNIVQSITKSSAGADGAGRWNIPVTSLPTTSGEAQTAWDAAGIGRDEVESDQAWFYTGTEANPTAQSVWIYDSGTSSWNEQEEVIDGDLLVTGTVTSDKVETNFIDAFTINANNITTGELRADLIRIDGLTLDTETVTPPIGDPYQVLIIANEDSPNGAGVDSQQIVTDATFAHLGLRFNTLSYSPPNAFVNDVLLNSPEAGVTLTFDFGEDFYTEFEVTGRFRNPTSATTMDVYLALQKTTGFDMTTHIYESVPYDEWYNFSMCGFEAVTAGLAKTLRFTAGTFGDDLEFKDISVIVRFFKR